MSATLMGVALVLLSLWQFYAAYKEFMRVKTKGNKDTPLFTGYSVYYSFFFAVILLLFGIQALLS